MIPTQEEFCYICYSNCTLKHSHCLKKSFYLSIGLSEQVREKFVREWKG